MAVMNLDCNLACTYCYEGKQRGHHYMSTETADLLVKYCEENFLQQGKDLIIDFYGGEPLLSLDLIKSISLRLQAAAEKAGDRICLHPGNQWHPPYLRRGCGACSARTEERQGYLGRPPREP